MDSTQPVDYEAITDLTNKLLVAYDITKPIVNVFHIAQNEGLTVEFVQMPEQYKDVSGVLDMEHKKIVVNVHDPVPKQLFTIAHELGHYILGHKPNEFGILYRWYSPEKERNFFEKEANAFAANLLVPHHMLREKMTQYNLTDQDEGLLAQLFGVTTITMKFRLRHMSKS